MKSANTSHESGWESSEFPETGEYPVLSTRAEAGIDSSNAANFPSIHSDPFEEGSKRNPPESISQFEATSFASHGRYEIVEEIGKGGMATVYRAYQPNLDRFVAIKIIHRAIALDSASLERFQREARVLASLNHPNVAAIYGLEGNAIVMELVDGANLRGPLPVNEAIGVARQIVDAIGMQSF